MAKKKSKTTWAQRVGRRMNRRQKARQAVKLAEAGVDPTTIGGFGKRGGGRGRGGALDVSGPIAGPDWQEYLLPAAVLGGLALVLTRKDQGR